jgi:3-phenylpropionate/trans-cinnamate dioxygenase ferredoxin reductase subunit
VPDGILIIGGGLAGQRCAETLRRSGYEGTVTMVCSEPHRPYDRPPLSKGMLSGEHDGEALPFRSSEWYADQSIELLLGASATSLCTEPRRVQLSDGTTLPFEKILIATGGRPRTLPLLDGRHNVSVLRSLDDSELLRDTLGRGSSVSILGAGFIGQEVAATARKLGAQVTMIEAAPSPLFGVLGGELGDWFSRLHREEGVRVVTHAIVERIDANGFVRGLHLSDGQYVPTDHVVVGVGVEPDIGWLNGSDLATPAGILVDADGRTSHSDVFAAGDAAATFDPVLDRHVPGSHWEAAARQGGRVARAMLGLESGRAPLTSFWTDQYGIRIQYIGHARLADAMSIDGEPESRDFTATFTRAGRPVGALLVDRPRALPAVRKLIENGGSE